jgi:hypothetical protein
MSDLGGQSLTPVAARDGPPDFTLLVTRASDVQDCFSNNLPGIIQCCHQEERRARLGVLFVPAPFDERVYIVAFRRVYREVPPIVLLPHIGVHRFRIGGLHISKAKAGGLDHRRRPR